MDVGQGIAREGPATGPRAAGFPRDTCCDLNDFSISHDLADVVPLTRQARQLNPDGVKLMMTPWSAPAWMKDNDNFIDQGWLMAQYYPMYAQYFVKTLQAYEAQGIHVDYDTSTCLYFETYFIS